MSRCWEAGGVVGGKGENGGEGSRQYSSRTYSATRKAFIEACHIASSILSSRTSLS